MQFYNQLQADTEQERQAFLSIPTLQLGMQGDISLKSYVEFLTQAYHHVRHTAPLLMACGARLPADKEWLREAVAEYIEEELGHQEWILNDIAACGADAKAVRNSRPHYTTELMVAYAYDSIQRVNPLSFFGMVLVLEGTSVAMATHAAATIKRKLDLPTAAFSYLNSHGSLDQSHIHFYEELMNRIDDEQDRQAITHAAKMFYQLYGDIFRAIPIDELKERNAA
jgi:pyrroloquinoline quinone (PQQ) biosynthesis protein C